MKYTIVQNNTVVNVIDADEAFILANYDNDIVVEGEYRIGYLFQDGAFVPPTKLTVDESAIVATTGYTNPAVTKITVGAMKARIFAEEFNAISASTNIFVNKIWDDLGSSLYIDLNDTRFIQGVGYILSYLATIPTPSDASVMIVDDVTTRLNALIVNGTNLEKYNGVL